MVTSPRSGREAGQLPMNRAQRAISGPSCRWSISVGKRRCIKGNGKYQKYILSDCTQQELSLGQKTFYYNVLNRHVARKVHGAQTAFLPNKFDNFGRPQSPQSGYVPGSKCYSPTSMVHCHRPSKEVTLHTSPHLSVPCLYQSITLLQSAL